MASTGVTRIEGVDPAVAIKAPCDVATTSNITLSGSQTINGVAVTETTPATRVLVRSQADGSENGVWDVKGTAWVRSEDWDGNRDVVNGTAVSVTGGDSFSNTTFRVIAPDPITIGSTSIAFGIRADTQTYNVADYTTLRAGLLAENYSVGDAVTITGQGAEETGIIEAIGSNVDDDETIIVGGSFAWVSMGRRIALGDADNILVAFANTQQNGATRKVLMTENSNQGITFNSKPLKIKDIYQTEQAQWTIVDGGDATKDIAKVEIYRSISQNMLSEDVWYDFTYHSTGDFWEVKVPHIYKHMFLQCGSGREITELQDAFGFIAQFTCGTNMDTQFMRVDAGTEYFPNKAQISIALAAGTVSAPVISSMSKPIRVGETNLNHVEVINETRYQTNLDYRACIVNYVGTLGTDDLAVFQLWKSMLGEVKGITWRFHGEFNSANQSVIRYNRSEGRFKTCEIDVQNATFSGSPAGVVGLYSDRPLETFDCKFQGGSANNLTITGATQANPCVLTVSGHGYTTGEKVFIDNVGGMTELNDRTFIVTVLGANTFSLDGEDATGHTAYTSGGTSTLMTHPMTAVSIYSTLFGGWDITGVVDNVLATRGTCLVTSDLDIQGIVETVFSPAGESTIYVAGSGTSLSGANLYNAGSIPLSLHIDNAVTVRSAWSAYKGRTTTVNTTMWVDDTSAPQLVLSGSVSELGFAQGGTVGQSIGNIASPSALELSGDGTNRHLRVLSSGDIEAGSDNVYKMGSASRRWSEVFAGNGTINTSDEREKTDWLSLSEAEKVAAAQIKNSMRRYRWIDAKSKKGESARYHIGTGAQTVKQILIDNGLNPDMYSFLCFDEWPELIEEFEKNGETIKTVTPAGSRYGLRYDELIMFVLCSL